jgi:DNA-binding transcriptional regulator YiaG
MQRKLKRRNPGSLAAIRIGYGCTQKEFARRLGISRSCLAMAEAGHRLLAAGASKRIMEMERAGGRP